MSAGRYRVIDPLQLDGKRIAPGEVVELDDGAAVDQLVAIGAIQPTEEASKKPAAKKPAA